jgi:SH3 domain-containing protein
MRVFTGIVLAVVFSFAALAETGKSRTDLNLRSAPSSRARVITVLAVSDQFEILESRRGWYRVRLANGVEGWASQRYVDIVPPSPPAGAEETPTRTNGPFTFMVLAAIAMLLIIGTLLSRRDPKQHNPIPLLVVSTLLGAAYLCLSLPKGVNAVGTARGWNWLASIGELGLRFNDTLAAELPAFPTLLRYLFLITGAYLVSLLLLAIRHQQMPLFVAGAVTLGLSTAMFHLVAWIGFIVVKVLMGVAWVFGVIGRFFAWLITTIGGFIIRVIVAISMWIYEVLHGLFGAYWWVILLCVAIAGVAYVARKSGNLVEALKAIGAVLGLLLLAGLVAWVARWIWQFIGPWVLKLLEYVGAFFLFLFTWIFKLMILLGALLSVAFIGQLLLDQIQGALSAGRRRGGVILGALAIGSSIAILMLVSNVYQLATWLPAVAGTFALQWLHQATPLLDCLIALAMVALSIVGVWTNIVTLGEEPTAGEFGRSAVYSILGVFVAGAVVAVGTQTEQ